MLVPTPLHATTMGPASSSTYGVAPAAAAIEVRKVDALGSEKDEPGCLRFNVLKDAGEENTYYFFEVYKDQAAIEAHRGMPHYQVWAGVADTLEALRGAGP